MTRPILPAALLLALAACSDNGQGTSIAITGDNGQVQGALDGGSGAVKIDTPVFKGEFTMPKIQLDADSFDLNGVHLYPGSTIKGVDVAARDNGGVTVNFESPATPAAVRDWFAERLAKAGFTLTAGAGGLTGTTEENKPFRLDLAPAAGNGQRAAGKIVIGG